MTDSADANIAFAAAVAPPRMPRRRPSDIPDLRERLSRRRRVQSPAELALRRSLPADAAKPFSLEDAFPSFSHLFPQQHHPFQLSIPQFPPAAIPSAPLSASAKDSFEVWPDDVECAFFEGSCLYSLSSLAISFLSFSFVISRFYFCFVSPHSG